MLDHINVYTLLHVDVAGAELVHLVRLAIPARDFRLLGTQQRIFHPSIGCALTCRSIARRVVASVGIRWRGRLPRRHLSPCHSE